MITTYLFVTYQTPTISISDANWADVPNNWANNWQILGDATYVVTSEKEDLEEVDWAKDGF